MPSADEERDRRKKLAKVKSSKAVSRSKRLIQGSRERMARVKERIKGRPKSRSKDTAPKAHIKDATPKALSDLDKAA